MSRWGTFLAALLPIVFFAAVGTPVHAEVLDPVRIEGDAATVRLDGRFARFTDNDPSLTLDDVLRRDEFRVPEREFLEGGIRWYKIVLVRGQGVPDDWILAFGEPDIDDVRVFVSRPDGGFAEARLGRSIPSESLPLAARQHMARISLPEGQPATVVLRLASRHKIRFEMPALWRPDALMFHEVQESTLFGVRAGMLVVLILGYALFGGWMKDAAMVLYATYVATVLSRGLTHSGVAAVVFPGAGATVNYALSAIGLIGSAAAFAFMWDRILDLRKNWPKVHRIYVGGGLALLFSLSLTTTPVFPVIAVLSHLTMLAASIGSVILALAMVRRDPQNVLLKFYVAAFVPLISVGLAHVAFPLLPMVPIELGRTLDGASNALHIGILGIALAYRLGRTERERARIKGELTSERQMQGRLRAFIDTVTHEFKTPLAVIDSSAQMLELQSPGRADVHARIATIRRSVKRLVGLIETCLAGERCETVQLSLALVSPAAIAAEAAERNRVPGHCAIVCEIRGIPEDCLADGAVLGIALDALIDNARRYGPPDEPVEILVEAHKGTVVFAISDRGPGVPPDEAERIFDKYFRGSTGASTVGTGIGLHLVKTIAALHGGTVRYEDRPGGGATFLLTIPVRPG